VNNTEDVLQYIKKTVNHNTRIFTFGIGAEASKILVRGISKYGRGKDEFVITGERMEGKVMKQLKRALSPILKDIRVDWGDLPVIDSESKSESQYPPIFDGEKLIIYNFIQSNQLDGIHTVIITGKTGEQVHKWTVSIDLINDKIEGSLIHRLTAKQFLKALELNMEQNKEKIIQLATKWGLVSKCTSFVAVEERDYHSEESSGLNKINIRKEMKNKQPEPQPQKISYNYSVPHTRSEGNRFIANSDTDDHQNYFSSRSSLARNESRNPVMLSASNEDKGFSSCSATPDVGSFLPDLPGSRKHRRRIETEDSIEDNENHEAHFNIISPRNPMIKPLPEYAGIATTTQTRPLDIFVYQQNASGAFSLTDKFLSSAGIKNNLKELISACPAITDSHLTILDKEMVWATVIALVVFERTFNDLKDEWELIYEKSKKWINSRLKGGHTTLSQLLEHAKAVINF